MEDPNLRLPEDLTADRLLMINSALNILDHIVLKVFGQLQDVVWTDDEMPVVEVTIPWTRRQVADLVESCKGDGMQRDIERWAEQITRVRVFEGYLLGWWATRGEDATVEDAAKAFVRQMVTEGAIDEVPDIEWVLWERTAFPVCDIWTALSQMYNYLTLPSCARCDIFRVDSEGDLCPGCSVPEKKKSWWERLWK